MRVAIIHDWLGPMTGAERVLEQLLLCYPDADVFTTVDFLPTEHRGVLRGARVFSSFIQHLPGAARHIWHYVPLMPAAVACFNLQSYDLVLSNSHTVAKGVRVRPDQVHVCYLLSPMRFAWDLEEMYLREHGYGHGVKRLMARGVFAGLRRWDASTSARVDAFIAISRYIAQRAQRCYGRQSAILHPPVDLAFFQPGAERGDFYLAASRLTPFKRLDLIAEAFRSMPDRKLVIIGDGPQRDRVRRAAGANVTLLGYQSDEALRDYMRRARAFVFAAPEDFGLVMAEAQACGTPVIALADGGATDIVNDQDPGRTGWLFPDQSASAIAEAIHRFEDGPAIAATDCRRNAERFSPERFRHHLQSLVEQAVSRRGGQGGASKSAAATPSAMDSAMLL